MFLLVVLFQFMEAMTAEDGRPEWIGAWREHVRPFQQSHDVLQYIYRVRMIKD